MDLHKKALDKAYKDALKKLEDDSTVENIKLVAATKKALIEYQELLDIKNNRAEESFKNISEVLPYLKAEGWAIGKTKLYQDAKFIGRQKGGAYLKADVDKYAVQYLKQVEDSGDEAVFAGKKNEADIRIAIARAVQLERENDINSGKWILKSEVAQMLAKRAALLKESVGMGFIHSNAEDIIDIVGGKQGKASELIAFWLKKADKFFDQYSKPVTFAIPAKDGKEKKKKSLKTTKVRRPAKKKK